MSTTRRRARRGLGERGQALAETAIVLPILIGVLIGIFEFGRAWNIRQVITNTAREGARLAVIPTTSEADVVDAVTTRLQDASLDPGVATVDIDNMGAGTGTIATVTVSYPHTFLFLGPVVELMAGDDASGIPGAITLSSTSRMRNE